IVRWLREAPDWTEFELESGLPLADALQRGFAADSKKPPMYGRFWREGPRRADLDKTGGPRTVARERTLSLGVSRLIVATAAGLFLVSPEDGGLLAFPTERLEDAATPRGPRQVSRFLLGTRAG